MFDGQVDRDAVDGDDAVRAAMLDAYLQRGYVRVKHVLVLGRGGWYGTNEGVIEIDGRYVDQDGDVLGEGSDSERRTWVIGQDCLVLVKDGTGTRLASGDAVSEGDTLVAVICPRCGDWIGHARDQGFDEAGVLRCGRCLLEIETESIAADWV